MPGQTSKTRLSADEREALRKQMAREQETAEQKWVRAAIREEIADWAAEFFGDGAEGEDGPKDSGPLSFLGLKLGG